jgi:2-aminoadipate transaminase
VQHATIQGVAVSADEIAITPGNSAALGMLFSNHRLRRQQPAQPGQGQQQPSAVVEHPTYFLSRDMLLDAGIAGRGCAVDREGIRLDELRKICAAGDAPALVYLNPNFHNPTGSVLSQERREELISLAVEYDFLVLSDEPYNLLCFDDGAGGTTAARPLALEPGATGHVLSLGSFSKILAPGLRIGWMQGAKTEPAFCFFSLTLLMIKSPVCPDKLRTEHNGKCNIENGRVSQVTQSCLRRPGRVQVRFPHALI